MLARSHSRVIAFSRRSPRGPITGRLQCRINYTRSHSKERPDAVSQMHSDENSPVPPRPLFLITDDFRRMPRARRKSPLAFLSLSPIIYTRLSRLLFSFFLFFVLIYFPPSGNALGACNERRVSDRAHQRDEELSTGASVPPVHRQSRAESKGRLELLRSVDSWRRGFYDTFVAGRRHNAVAVPLSLCLSLLFALAGTPRPSNILQFVRPTLALPGEPPAVSGAVPTTADIS